MKCPICGTAAVETFEAQYLRVAKCASPDCGHLWAIEAQEGLGVQTLTVPEVLVATYEARNRALAQLFLARGFLRLGDRLLDMGAGSGHLISVLRQEIAGIQIVAVEADVGGRARLRSLGFEAHASLDDVEGDFDAITLVEVIEHLDNPTGTLAGLRRRLRPGGRLFCTTPCGETRSRSRNTNAYSTPEHVQFFTEKSLGICMNKAGFNHFDLETINAISGDNSPLPTRYLKNILRPIRAALLGHHHLTGFART